MSSTRTGHLFYLRNGFVDEAAAESRFGLDCLRMRKAL